MKPVAPSARQLDRARADALRVVDSAELRQEELEHDERDDERLVRVVADRFRQARRFLERGARLRAAAAAPERARASEREPRIEALRPNAWTVGEAARL